MIEDAERANTFPDFTPKTNIGRRRQIVTQGEILTDEFNPLTVR